MGAQPFVVVAAALRIDGRVPGRTEVVLEAEDQELVVLDYNFLSRG